MSQAAAQEEPGPTRAGDDRALWVRTEEAERGSLPARCIRTGERCITRRRLTSRELPAWLEWLTWTDLWPRQRGAAPVPVVVSVLPGVWRTIRGLRVARDVLAGALVLLLVAALVLPEGAGRVAGLLAVAAVMGKLLVAAAGLWLAPDVRLDTTGEWVHLTGAHPDLVTAARTVTTRPASPPEAVQPSVRSVVARLSTTTEL